VQLLLPGGSARAATWCKLKVLLRRMWKIASASVRLPRATRELLVLYAHQIVDVQKASARLLFS
jgi:hypothetical protein